MHDWRAPLARRLMRAAWRPMRWERPALLLLVVLVWLVSAMWGTWLRQAAASEAAPLGWRILDLLYAPFVYLLPDSDFAFAHDLLWQEALARVVGPLVPLLGLFWLTRRQVLAALAELLLAHGARGHAIVFGDEGSADELAIASSQAGETVLLCDPSVPGDEDRLAALGPAGVVTSGSLPSRLDTVGTIALWSAADADNLVRAISLRSREDTRAGDLILRLASPDMHRTLIQAPDLAGDSAIRLRPVSEDGVAIRRALGGHEPVALAVKRGQPRVTLCLWGEGEALEWAAELALRQFWSARLGAPQVFRVGETDLPLPPALAHFARHAGETFDADALPTLATIRPEAAIHLSEATWHLVDCGDTEATIDTALPLAARLRQGSADPPPVQPVLRADAEIAQLFPAQSSAFLTPIIADDGLTLASLQDRSLDEAAAKLHLAYDRQHGGGTTAPASGKWEDLAETYIAANRAAADHMAVKRWDADQGDLTREELVEALAWAEHNRWSAERLLAGWAPAGEAGRDNDRRLHPDLRPWSALSEDAREKDRSQVREAIGNTAERD